MRRVPFRKRRNHFVPIEHAASRSAGFSGAQLGDVGGGVMFRWNTRIATFFIVSAVIATTAAAQPQKPGGKPGGAPAARAAPAAPAPHAAPTPHPAAAPHAAPAPQVSAPRAAPHIAAPRAAPQIAAPRHAPPPASAQRAAPQTPHAAPRQFARPSGGPARLGHGAARADTADLCGSRAATAANHRPQCRRTSWTEGCPPRPARQSGECTLSCPPFTRLTCKRPCLRSICAQRSEQSS
jgi:hypothetical protein